MDGRLLARAHDRSAGTYDERFASPPLGPREVSPAPLAGPVCAGQDRAFLLRRW